MLSFIAIAEMPLLSNVSVFEKFVQLVPAFIVRLNPSSVPNQSESFLIRISLMVFDLGNGLDHPESNLYVFASCEYDMKKTQQEIIWRIANFFMGVSQFVS
jgi:hypothetical protein